MNRYEELREFATAAMQGIISVKGYFSLNGYPAPIFEATAQEAIHYAKALQEKLDPVANSWDKIQAVINIAKRSPCRHAVDQNVCEMCEALKALDQE